MHRGNVLACSCSCIVALVLYKVATELKTVDLMKQIALFYAEFNRSCQWK